MEQGLQMCWDVLQYGGQERDTLLSEAASYPAVPRGLEQRQCTSPLYSFSYGGAGTLSSLTLMG